MLLLRYLLSQTFSLNVSLHFFLKHPVLQSFKSLLFLNSLSLSIFAGSCFKDHKCFHPLRMQWCRKCRTCSKSDISITTTAITKRFCIFSIIFITCKEKIFKLYVVSKITITIAIKIIQVGIDWLVSI